MRMPDGETFDFWDDETEYGRVLHVAAGHPSASDENPGSEDLPFKTIARAGRLGAGRHDRLRGGAG